MKTLLLKMRDYVLTTFVIVLCVLVVTAMLATVFPSIGLAFEDFTIHARTKLFVGNSSTDVSFIALNNDSVRVQSRLLINERVTAGSSKFATIDSFLSTAVVETVVVTGASVGDVFLVTPYLPSYSTTPDTGSSPYAARCLNTDSVIVLRTKLTAASTLKSAGHFFLTTINK